MAGKESRALLRLSTVDHFKVFCEESAIVGFQYIASRSGWCSKLTWIILISAAIAGASWFISNLVEDWKNTPTMTTTYTTDKAIQDIHFPSVTICPDESDPLGYIQK